MLARVVAVAGTAAVVLSVAVPPASANPGVTGISPTSGVTGGTVVVTGSGLTNASNVTFNGVPASSFTKVSDAEVDAVVPSTATTGPVAVAMSDGSTVGGPTYTVTPVASLVTSAWSVTYPGTVALTATVTSGGAPVRSEPTATLQALPAGSSTWADVQQKPADWNGWLRFHVRPLATTAYRVVFAATSAYGGATTGAVRVVQHPQVLLALASVAPILTAVRVTGSVRPAQTGKVQLERRYSGAWHAVSATSLTTAGHYAFSVKLPTKSTFTYRVRRLADAHQAGGVSAAATVLGVDRTLHSGLSGPDVTALQRRLAQLRYDVGGITGTYNFDTQHAVTAFEKVQRLTRDGVVGTGVWKALAAPRLPHLKHPLPGAAVEVDLTRQVLYYAVNGSIVRILDSSTGGGYYYTGSDGTTQRAITPTGHFSVKYKVNHWVTAKLGVLYRPAYFNYSGYAIHGEPEVPSYPASHGCVRITVPAMDRLYSKLFDGMSVWIYRS